MRHLILLFAGLMLIIAGCGSQKKAQTSEQEDLNRETKQLNIPVDEKIIEKEEKIVEPSSSHSEVFRYYVIVGSFKFKTNALTRQKEVDNKGLPSELLRNEEGFYRVSVIATDDVSFARERIHWIRENNPEYADTWLLIRKEE